MLTLVSATPSPFARMNRIAMMEKGIPFQLQNEIPWHEATETPKYNPLEKLPILIFDDGRDPVYDSAFIQQYIVEKYADKGPSLMPGNLDDDLKAKQILTLSEGLLDAHVLLFWETSRDADKQSQKWLARQNRKLDGALGAFEALVKNKPSGSDYLLGDALTIADIAVGCATTQLEFAALRPGWQDKYPHLATYVKKLEERETFKQTMPKMFDIKPETVV